MKVLGGVRGNTADAYFRIMAPFSVLRYSTQHEFEIRQPAIGDSEEFDVLWLQRHCEAMAEVIAREFKDAGKPVIYDVDDWLFGMPPSWHCYSNYYDRGTGNPTVHLIFHERLMRLADVVTCPTPHLADKIYKRLSCPPTINTKVVSWDKEPRVHILPNCIVQGEWDTVLPLEVDFKGPKIGWMGLGYHWDDWVAMSSAVEDAVIALDGHLIILGAPEVIQCFSKELAERTYVQSAVAWENFALMRQMMKTLDVGIAWLQDTDFNRCKSHLKALQYGAAGVPVVASKTVYGDLPGWWEEQDANIVIHDHGITVGDADAIGHAIRIAINQKERSAKHAAAWRQEVWQNHSYEQQARLWLSLLESLV